MNILVTGKYGAGSWAIRGDQLGHALDATVKPSAKPADVDQADIVVVVKRMPPNILTHLIRTGKKWVFDCVDFYPQPTVSDWKADKAIEWVKHQLLHLDPTGIVWPTHRMADDCDIGKRSIVLPHHFRPGSLTNPIRDEVKLVGYEGNSLYLGEWRSALEQECEKRGWRFTINPVHLADLDIVVAFRGGIWSGYAQRHWKSNVKLANAHGSGTPFIGQQEYGYIESACNAEYWAENVHELRTCFDWLAHPQTRREVQQRFLENTYSVEQAARDLKAFLSSL